MVPSGEVTRLRQSWPWWRWIVTSLCALGLALSAYLSWHYLVGGTVIGCGGGSSCDQVLNSRWSAIGRGQTVLPVSSLAAGAYLAMLAASFFMGLSTETPVRHLAWRAMLVLAGAAAGSAVWFTFVQLRIVGAFCPYCVATHITGVLLAALVIWQAPRQVDGDSTKAVPSGRVIRPWPAIGMTLVGMTLAAIMAAGQIAFAPPAVYRAGASQNNLPAIDPHAAPLLGSPDAPYVVTLLFDYECPHCQKLHAMLDEVMKRYDGKLAFVLCPTPLNNQCNPYIPQYVEEFKDSCELTKIALAVWAAKREAFPDFDRWRFSPQQEAELWHPRSPDAAKAKAIELVGPAQFAAAQTDPRIEEYMQTCIRLFGDTIDQSGNSVPRLVFGARWVTPEPSDANELISILQKSLALPNQ